MMMLQWEVWAGNLRAAHSFLMYCVKPKYFMIKKYIELCMGESY